MTILIEDGTYEVTSTTSFPYITANNGIFRSVSGNRNAVILTGAGMKPTSSTEDGFLIAGDNVTIADLTFPKIDRLLKAVTLTISDVFGKQIEEIKSISVQEIILNVGQYFDRIYFDRLPHKINP